MLKYSKYIYSFEGGFYEKENTINFFNDSYTCLSVCYKR